MGTDWAIHQRNTIRVLHLHQREPPMRPQMPFDSFSAGPAA